MFVAKQKFGENTFNVLEKFFLRIGDTFYVFPGLYHSCVAPGKQNCVTTKVLFLNFEGQWDRLWILMNVYYKDVIESEQCPSTLHFYFEMESKGPYFSCCLVLSSPRLQYSCTYNSCLENIILFDYIWHCFLETLLLASLG
uniref:JmjC domain-containing protein n=1 Tax=Molossus molossus TaxID=27622 RepID=A0A7J8ERU1_MOLMO|nr:hypothetical protein HJG59_008723 [Molossus molossus]